MRHGNDPVEGLDDEKPNADLPDNDFADDETIGGAGCLPPS